MCKIWLILYNILFLFNLYIIFKVLFFCTGNNLFEKLKVTGKVVYFRCNRNPLNLEMELEKMPKSHYM